MTARTSQLTIEPRPNQVAVVRLAGNLDLVAASDIRKELAQAVAAGHSRLVLDLSGVAFIDSTGLSSLISGLKNARLAGGDLRIAQPSAQVKTILELTMLTRVLRPYATVEEALIGY